MHGSAVEVARMWHDISRPLNTPALAAASGLCSQSANLFNQA
jgi:hypothetical protein